MPNNILITPGSASIAFSGSGANTIRLQVEPSGSIAFYGVSGTLFGITDSLSGSLMSVNDISGLPILEVFSDDKVVAGTFNTNTLVVTGSRVGIGTSTPSTLLHISGTVSASIYSSSVVGGVGFFGTSSYAISAAYSSLTGIPVGIVSGSGQVSYTSLANIPVGIVSSSAQTTALLPVGTVSSSAQATGWTVTTATGNAGTATTLQTARLINGTSFNGSANIIITASYSTLTEVPVGIVSSSTQASGWTVTTATGNAGTATTLQTARLINGTSFNGSANIIITASYSTLTEIPVGIVSSSTQASSWTVANANTLTNARLINGTSFNGSANIIITSSYSTLTSVPVGIVSSSTQTSAWSAATLTTARLINGTSFDGSTNIIITASYSTLTSVPVGIVSSSTQTSGWSAATLTTARNIAGTSFNGSADIGITYSNLTGIPVGIVSSSTQASGWSVNYATSAGTVTTNANLTGHVTSVGNATSLGSFSVAQLNAALNDGDVATGGGTATGTNTGDQTTVTGNAGTATTLQTARLINGTSFNGSANIIITASYATLTSVPVGIVSSSTQVSYTGLSNIPVGIVSSSAQVQSSDPLIKVYYRSRFN